MKNSTVVLGVTGSIAAYKACEIVSALKKACVDVFVIMTDNARSFVADLTFETLSANPVACGMFEKKSHFDIEHISLAKRADLFLVAPASANFIAKLANGIADDMLTTVAMATKAPIYIAPAMNTAMYQSTANLRNMKILKEDGVQFIEPGKGLLACGDIGVGKLQDVSIIVETVLNALNHSKKDLLGKNILVTAGPTREMIDPVRYISNRSSGKMGYAIAKAAVSRGANVTLISGPVALPPVYGAKMINIESTGELYNAAMENFPLCDIAIKAAAPADFTPAAISDIKIKKTNKDIMSLDLIKTKDILAAMGEIKGERFLCGFAAETTDLEKYAVDKLRRKNLDMIVANDVGAKGAGFDVDTNIVTIFYERGKKELPIASKADIAHGILDEIILRLEAGR